jgi:hypothetical protein
LRKFVTALSQIAMNDAKQYISFRSREAKILSKVNGKAASASVSVDVASLSNFEF